MCQVKKGLSRLRPGTTKAVKHDFKGHQFESI